MAMNLIYVMKGEKSIKVPNAGGSGKVLIFIPNQMKNLRNYLKFIHDYLLFQIGASIRDDAKALYKLLKKEVNSSRDSSDDCDESFVAASVLANDFVSLTIVAVPIKVNGLTKGFGPGIHISSSRETDGNDSFVTSDRLFKALKDEDRGSLRSIVAEDDDIKFTVLASNMPICIDPLTQMASEAISPPVDETLVSPTGAAGTDLDTSV